MENLNNIYKKLSKQLTKKQIFCWSKFRGLIYSNFVEKVNIYTWLIWLAFFLQHMQQTAWWHFYACFGCMFLLSLAIIWRNTQHLKLYLFIVARSFPRRADLRRAQSQTPWGHTPIKKFYAYSKLKHDFLENWTWLRQRLNKCTFRMSIEMNTFT